MIGGVEAPPVGILTKKSTYTRSHHSNQNSNHNSTHSDKNNINSNNRNITILVPYIQGTGEKFKNV